MKMAAARKCKRHLLLFEDVFIRNLCPYRSAHLAATLPSGRMISVHRAQLLHVELRAANNKCPDFGHFLSVSIS
jgi:hypothetical protein